MSFKINFDLVSKTFFSKTFGKSTSINTFVDIGMCSAKFVSEASALESAVKAQHIKTAETPLNETMLAHGSISPGLRHQTLLHEINSYCKIYSALREMIH